MPFQTSRALTIATSLLLTDHSPRSLRQTFEKLGPTFVKLGQLIASRPDMFPHPYTSEFRQLLDHTDPIPFATVQQILKANLPGDLSAIFSDIDPNPVSSASIGQVHKAKLKKGKTVAIKVRRPKIKEIIKQDTQIIRSLTKILKLHPAFRDGEFDKVVEEFTYWIQNELDFRTEAHNAQKLAVSLEKNSLHRHPRNLHRLYYRRSNGQLLSRRTHSKRPHHPNAVSGRHRPKKS